MSKECNDMVKTLVLDLLRANPHKRFRLKYLSTLFNVSEASVRMVMAENPNIRTEKTLDARTNYFYVDVNEKRAEKWVKPFTPMTPELYKKRIDVKGVVSV